ncbi:MAG: hypothetical protein K0V04_34590 [Deltaproteobacteria bacterium]|nr:hypothetical protein [Deltaproteobacteria bacterium]
MKTELGLADLLWTQEQRVAAVDRIDRAAMRYAAAERKPLEAAARAWLDAHPLH